MGIWSSQVLPRMATVTLVYRDTLTRGSQWVLWSSQVLPRMATVTLHGVPRYSWSSQGLPRTAYY